MTPELQTAHHEPVSQEEEEAEAQRLHSFPRSHRTGAGWDPMPSRPSLGSGCGAGRWQPGGQSPFWGSGLWSPSLPLLPGQAQSQGLGEFRKPSSGLCSPAAQPPALREPGGEGRDSWCEGPKGPGQALTDKPRAWVVPPLGDRGLCSQAVWG